MNKNMITVERNEVGQATKKAFLAQYRQDGYQTVGSGDTILDCVEFIRSQAGVKYAVYAIFGTGFGDYEVAYDEETIKLS